MLNNQRILATIGHPICSMYGLFTYTYQHWVILCINVGMYINIFYGTYGYCYYCN
jgi:hypothetical protein